MSDKRSSWAGEGSDDDAPSGPASALAEAKHKAAEIGGKAAEIGGKAAEIGGKVAANVRPVADATFARVRSGLDKVGDALRVDGAPVVSAELLSQADLPELTQGEALASLARRLDREADFWRAVAMRQLARAAWTERLGVAGSLLLLVGGVVLAAIAAFRALVATKGGDATAMLLGVGLGVLLVSALAVGRLSTRLRQGQLEAVRDAMKRADLAELRLHRLALLLELREVGRDGYVAALTELEADVRRA
jgi:hypothetical protein